jgi:hypothetical protein
MARKKQPLPLHVSLARIEAERVATAQRTRTRIAQLMKHEEDNNDEDEVAVTNILPNHFALNICCFCVLLVLLNLLFLQWVYHKVLHT